MAATFGLLPQKSVGFDHLLWENDKTLRRCTKGEFSAEAFFFFFHQLYRAICWKALLSFWLQGMSLIFIQNIFMFCPNILSFCFYSFKKISKDWKEHRNNYKNILLRKVNCGTPKWLAWMTFAEHIFTLQPLLNYDWGKYCWMPLSFFAHCPAFSCNSYFSSWYLAQCCILGLVRE